MGRRAGIARRARVGLLVVALAVSGCGSTTSSTKHIPTVSIPIPHGQGIGDPYYPDDGNLGYDVLRYHVALTYHPTSTSIDASTLVTARATRRLSRLDLDLTGFAVDSVRVNHRPARFTRAFIHELVIRPLRAIRDGTVFAVRVNYHGPLRLLPDQQVASGWHHATAPGSGFIAGEPHSCTAWYPCNDHPLDKARFALDATVPRPFSVVSNGSQLPTLNHGRMRTFRWRLDAPTTTYLTMMYVDRLTFQRSVLPGGVKVVSAFGPHPGAAVGREARLPAILSFLSSKFGPYPAPSAGGVFIDARFGFSLETYTRPMFTRGIGVSTIVHENAHQWWGDHVSIRHWRDVCLNECFASYAQWLWDEHNGANLDHRYRDDVTKYAQVFKYPLYDMGPGHEFDGPGVYFKGQWFLHALRNKLGTAAFFSALREIQRTYANRNLSMIGLRDRLEKDTGVDLTSFWHDWVLQTGVPSAANLYPGHLAP
jgi:aminopeptidase N